MFFDFPGADSERLVDRSIRRQYSAKSRHEPGQPPEFPTTDNARWPRQAGPRALANQTPQPARIKLELARLAALAHHDSVRADEESSPEQIAVFRRMTPEQRWQAAHWFYWTMRRHKAAFLHHQHPDWPASRVESEVRHIFSHART